MKKSFLHQAAWFSLVALASACSAGDELGGVSLPGDDVITRPVTMTALDFEFDDNVSTRTGFGITDRGAAFSWVAGDSIGIFPSANHQTAFAIQTEGEGAKTATFNGGSWALKKDSEYKAYYPFVGNIELDRTRIPVSFLGQQQTTDGNTTHLGKCDFMAAVASQLSESGTNVDFQFKHLACMVQFNFQLSEAATGLNSFTISSSENLFATDATFSLNDAEPKLTNGALSKSLTYTLGNFSSSGTSLTLYLMMAPSNLNGKTLNFTLTTTGRDTYEGTGTISMRTPDMKAGKAYRFMNVSMTKLDPYDKTEAMDDSKYPIDSRVYTTDKSRRAVSKISMTTTINGQSRTFSKDLDTKKRYLNHKETVFEAQAGQQVTSTIIYTEGWMFGHIFIDFGKDGFTGGKKGNQADGGDFYKPTGDLMSYSGYEEIVYGRKYYYSSASSSITGEGSAINPPTFTIPADTPAGVYRMRWTVDWNGISTPGGNFDGQNFNNNDGSIIDVLLKVYPAAQ